MNRLRRRREGGKEEFYYSDCPSAMRSAFRPGIGQEFREGFRCSYGEGYGLARQPGRRTHADIRAFPFRRIGPLRDRFAACFSIHSRNIWRFHVNCSH